MEDNRGKNSSSKNLTWVLALEAPSKNMMRVNEEKHEGTHRDILTVNQGQDLREKVMTYFRNSTNSSRNSNRRVRMGVILSATGSVLHPKMDTENSSASDEGSYDIKNLEGRFIISEDGEVQQHGSMTISCVGSSGLTIADQVNGRLIAAGPVQVTVGIFPLNPSSN